MAFGGGSGDPQDFRGGMLASAADREAAQAVLEKAFEEERLTQAEFESRIGIALSARTQGELARLTLDLPHMAAPPPRGPRRSSRVWLLAGGLAVVVAVGVVVAVEALSHGSSRPSASSPLPSAASQGPGSGQAPGTSQNASSGQSAGGPAGCPVGTSQTALGIANSLASDPVYLDPASSALTGAQAGRLKAEINRDNPGRIRIAVATRATVRRGGGFRSLANAIANCKADAPGTTLLSTPSHSYVVTSYQDFNGAAQAVQAALNTHASLAAGLRDAVSRLTTVDQNSS